MIVYRVFSLLKVGFDMRSCEIVEDNYVDEDGDHAAREAKDARYDADDGEDHGDGSGPRSARPQTPRHDESQYR